MKIKRVAALLLALLMLVVLAAGCSSSKPQTEQPTAQTGQSGKEETTGTKPSSGQTSSGQSSGSSSDNTPTELEPLTISILNSCSYARCSSTFEDCLAKGDKALLFLEEAANKKYGIVLDRTNVASDAFVTTLNGMLAANTPPDTYGIRALGDATSLQLAQQGKLADMDEILALSNGIASDIYSENGCMFTDRPACLLEDGKWYWFHPGNCNAWPLELSDTIEGGYFAKFASLNIYTLQVRNDWMKRLGMSMPKTVDELFDLLKAFQDNDMNGNGAADERAMFDMGAEQQYRGGLCNYWGLHQRWQLDINSGEICLPELEPGFVAYTQYCKRLYDNDLSYIDEGGTWSYTVDCAGDFCSAHVMYPGQIQFFDTGNGAQEEIYMSLPPMAAVEGIKPVQTWQANDSAMGSQAFSSQADPEACARFLDFICSHEYWEGTMVGLEGHAWEMKDGRMVNIQMSQEDIDAGYGFGLDRFVLAGYGPQCTLTGLYNPNAVDDHSVEEVLANGTDKTHQLANAPTHEAWVEYEKMLHPWITNDTVCDMTRVFENLRDFGPENLICTFCDTAQYLSAARENEAAMVSDYQSDIATFLDELCVNLITGVVSPDQYDEQIQIARDTLHLDELVQSYQDRANRTLVAIGRPAFSK